MTPGTPGPPGRGQVPYAAVRVPVEAGANARRIGLVVTLVCGGFAAVCAAGAAGSIVAGLPGAGAGLAAAALFWGLLAGAAWWWGHRSRAARAGFAAGATVVAVGPDGLDVGSGVLLAWADLEAVVLHWFALTSAPTLGRPGMVAAEGVIQATYERTGGNLGLAVAAYPRHPAPADRVPRPSPTGTTVAVDPTTGRLAVVVRAHRLVVDGDPAAVGDAIARVAPHHGVQVLGPPVPPPHPGPLPSWLHG